MSIKRLLGGLAGTSALSLVLAVAPVAAWSQLFNNFPGNPTSCDNSPSYPCVAWPTNGSLSVHLVVYLDPSLTSANLDLSTDVRNSITKWNAICAVNPLLAVGSGVNYDIGEYRGTIPSDPTAWASTDVYASGNTIVDAETTFNSTVTWNHSFSYPDSTHADSRKVSTHEMGHSEGLGHTSYTAVMHQGAESFWVPQTNDIQGMQHVYGSC